MAKKTQNLVPLTMTEIILRGDADTIRQALEARIQIDTLLEEREAAYKRIAELETQVCDIVGEDGIFPFPEPPMPVAVFAKATAPKKKAPAPVKSTDEPSSPEPEAPVEIAPKSKSEDETKDDEADTSDKA